jgi:hypothetical protein
LKYARLHSFTLRRDERRRKVTPFNQACAEVLKVSPSHGRRLVQQGKLPQPFRWTPNGRPYYTDEQIEKLRAERLAATEART